MEGPPVPIWLNSSVCMTSRELFPRGWGIWSPRLPKDGLASCYT